MINIHEPSISFFDKLEILKSLSTHWIGKGKKVDQFEDALKKYLSLDNIVTTTSGTQALYEVFRLLRQKTKKQKIIISSMSFIGILSSIKINNFDYVYADIDPDYLSLSLESIKEKIDNQTAAVVIQHYGGRPNYQIEEISQYLKEKNIFLIEDCATLLGGKINNKTPGSFSDYAIWSFDAMKIITTLDGGMIYCRNKNDLETIKNNIHFGMVEAPTTMTKFNENKNSWWELKPVTYGTKNILNNVTASLGISQLKQIDSFLNTQKKIWNYYISNIKNKKIKLPSPELENNKEAYFLFWIFSEEREALALYLKKNGVFSTFRYYPLHLSNLYYKKNTILPVTEEIYRTTLCIPCHKNLKEKEIKKVILLINSFL